MFHHGKVRFHDEKVREALDSGQPVNSRSPGGVTGLMSEKDDNYAVFFANKISFQFMHFFVNYVNHVRER